MTDQRVGRLLPASLHQAIAEELPDRLEYYEHWLRSETLRDGAVGLPAIRAVLGFLRTEPAGGYGQVMARAGMLAAEWHLAVVPAYRRRMIGWMPARLRRRSAMRLARALTPLISANARASSSVRGSEARFEVVSSVFCDVRDRSPAPLCGFYLAMVVGTLAQFGLAAHGVVERCHAVEAGQTCRLRIQLDGARSGRQARAA